MAAQSKLQSLKDTVVAFRKRAERAPVAVQCDEIKAVAICVHCGGWLFEGESEDDCSSARASQTL